MQKRKPSRKVEAIGNDVSNEKSSPSKWFHCVRERARNEQKKKKKTKTTLGKYHNGRDEFRNNKTAWCSKQSRHFDLVNRKNAIFTVELKLNKIPNIWHASHTHSSYNRFLAWLGSKHCKWFVSRYKYIHMHTIRKQILCHISHFDWF